MDREMEMRLELSRAKWLLGRMWGLLENSTPNCDVESFYDEIADIERELGEVGVLPKVIAS